MCLFLCINNIAITLDLALDVLSFFIIEVKYNE